MKTMMKRVYYRLFCFCSCGLFFTQTLGKGLEYKSEFYELKTTDKQRRAENKTCVLSAESNIQKFRHLVYYKELTFIYLWLVPENNKTKITGTTEVVGEDMWVWTFFGKHGSLESLSWPVEFGIWSMNILSEYVYGPMEIKLNVSGNCSNLVVGEPRTDYIISVALMNLTNGLIAMNKENEEKYGPSFWCYKKRIYIDSEVLYLLCKHLVCPVEALEYSCRSHFFNPDKGRREISRRAQSFKYDELWWIMPTVIAVILFCYIPLLILKISSKFSMSNNISPINEYHLMQEYIFIENFYQVTFFGTLFNPCRRINRASTSASRLVRIMVLFSSLMFICLQIVLDYHYLKSFVSVIVSKGVPLGFRSLLAGYEESACNFLPYLGGPYIALSLYLLIGITFLALPPSLSTLLVRGLPKITRDDYSSILVMSVTDVERYGSIRIRNRKGYHQVYRYMLGKLYMILNPRFWKFVFQTLCDRWKVNCKAIWCAVLLPFYIVLSIIEIISCILYNCFPIAAFAAIMTKAYHKTITSQDRTGGLRYYLLSLLIMIAVVYFMFMFSIIFMDAALFISRIFIFTYTGIIIYPKVSYGYLIFTVTVIYYVWDCIKQFSRVYQNLLKTTVKVCESIQRANDVDRLVINKNGLKGVKVVLFEHVIENHCPRRKQMFVSLVKVTIILTVIGISLDLLMKTDTFRELHIVMHVGTALFTCALPQVAKSICRGPDDKIKYRMFKLEIKNTIKDFLGYFEQTTESGDELNSDNII